MKTFSILYGTIAAPQRGKVTHIEAETAEDAFEAWTTRGPGINLSCIQYARIAEGNFTLDDYHRGVKFATVIENNRWAKGQTLVDQTKTEDSYNEYLSR